MIINFRKMELDTVRSGLDRDFWSSGIELLQPVELCESGFSDQKNLELYRKFLSNAFCGVKFRFTFYL